MNLHSTHTLLVTPDQGWSTLLQQHLTENGFAPLRSAATFDSALVQFSQGLPRLVLLDLSLPDGNVVDLCTEMLRVQPGAKVILVIDDVEEEAVGMLNHRVAGCINRHVPLAAWPGLLTYTLKGGAVFGGELLGALLAETRRVQKRPL